MEKLSLSEFQNRYGRSTERRQELAEQLVEWVRAVHSAGILMRLWVYGSFLSDKPGPQDLDFLAWVSTPTAGAAPGHVQPYLTAARPELDLALLTRQAPPELVESTLAWVGRGRRGTGRIVEVMP